MRSKRSAVNTAKLNPMTRAESEAVEKATTAAREAFMSAWAAALEAYKTLVKISERWSAGDQSDDEIDVATRALGRATKLMKAKAAEHCKAIAAARARFAARPRVGGNRKGVKAALTVKR